MPASDAACLDPTRESGERMRYLVVPIALGLFLFYAADQYFTRGTYFNALQNWVQSFF